MVEPAIAAQATLAELVKEPLREHRIAQAVLLQHQHSWTFSHYSRHYHAAEAYTLELGKVRPFGENDLDALGGMRAWLFTIAHNTR